MRQVLNNKAEATSTRSGYLGKALDRANFLYDGIKHDARGAALDANFLSTTSMLGAEQAGNLEKINPEKYISKLKAAFGFQKSSHSTKLKWPELAQAIADAAIFDLAPAATVRGAARTSSRAHASLRAPRAHVESGPVPAVSRRALRGA